MMAPSLHHARRSRRSAVRRPVELFLCALLTLALLPGCGNAGEAGAEKEPAEAEQPAGPDEAPESRPPQEGAANGEEEKADWTSPDFEARREDRMELVEIIRSSGVREQKVLDAMASVPRHEFVRDGDEPQAYRDRPLPIGYGQTISQPFIVAKMTAMLELQPDSKVLEVGTGSGYQAAVLTELTPHVYTIEIIEPLAKSAADRFERLGYDVVETRHGDGYFGWPEEAPFDGIIVTAAAGQVPPPLLKQLKPGGRMVIPVGPVYGVQSLMLVEKEADGEVRSRSVLPVRFVPLVRDDRTSE